MVDKWYINRNGQQYGPYTFTALKQFAYENRLSPQDMVWKEGMQNWIRSDMVPGLFNQGYGASPGNMHIQTEKPRKKKRWWILAYAVFSVFAAGIIAIAIFVPGGSKENVKKTILNAEGIVNIDGAVISLPENRSVKDAQITIKLKGSGNDVPENVYYRSDVYEIEGYLDNLNGDIKLEFPIPEKALKLPYKDIEELKKTLFIVVSKDGYSPSYGETTLEKRVETTIDLNKKTVSAVITFPNKGNVSGSRVYLANADKGVVVPSVPEEENQKHKIEARIDRYKFIWEELLSKGGNFKAIYSEDIFRENVDLILDDLEDFKKRIADELGFHTDERQYPVEIHIEKLKNEMGKYVADKNHDDDAYIMLDKTFFAIAKESPKSKKPNPDHAKRYEEMRITSAHELLHLYQDLYNPELNIFKSNWLFSSLPLLWIDEASSTWYETVVSKSNDYLPNNATKNLTFLNSPLCFTAKTEHGYGASFFIKYLVDKSNNMKFVSNIYKIIRRDQNTDTAAALKETCAKEKIELDTAWISFVNSYYRSPDDIMKNLDTNGAIKDLKLEGKGSGEDMRIEFQWEKRLENIKLTAVDGRLNDSEKIASIRLHFPLENLSADALRLTTSGSSTLSEMLKLPGRLNIRVKTEGKCGVFLYGDGKPIAGHPWNILGQSSDSRFKSVPEIAIDNFGKGLNELLFIPFNYDTDSAKKTAAVIMDISYTPLGDGLFVGDWRGEFDVLDGSFKEYPQLGKGIRFVITSETLGTSGITHETYYNSQGKTKDYENLKAKVNRLHFPEITEIKGNVISFRLNFTTSKPQNKPCWTFKMALSEDGNTMEGEYLEVQSNRRGHLKLTRYK